MSSRQGSFRGTVADRVRRFQNAQRLQDDATSRRLSPPIEIPAEGQQSHTGRGRRQELSSGPPAGRVSRDGPDGIHGDGRPPVGTPERPKTAHMGPSSALPPRPVTAMAGKFPFSDDPFMTPHVLSKSSRKQQSTEELIEPSTEIANARSRLRAINKQKQFEQRTSPDRSHTLAQLNEMIDDAIEEHAAENLLTDSRGADALTSPQQTMVRRWKSERSPRRSIEEVAFHAPQGPIDTTSHVRPATSHGLLSPSIRSPTHRWPRASTPLSRPQTNLALASPSPVKQRVTLFNSAHQEADYDIEPFEVPRGHIHEKKYWAVVPLHENTAERERQLHEWKFGKTIHEREDESAAALTQHQQPEDHRESVDTDHQTYDTAKQSPHTTDNSDENIQTSTGRVRKTSMSWPFKWRMFSKGSSAPPRAIEVAVSAPSERYEHHPISGPSMVRKKVQELLKRDEEEKSRRESELEQRSRRQSRRPSTVEEIRSSAEQPQLQTSVQEAADPSSAIETTSAGLIRTEASSDKKGIIPQSPVHRSWAEKEVMATSIPQSELTSVRSGSPVKPGPSTPVQGRFTKMRHSLTPKGSPYITEQTFTLSPLPSRSPSRTSSPIRVHKVEWEMRDSPEREARDRGEKILYVKTSAFEAADE